MARHFAERAATRFGLYPVMPEAEDMELLKAYSWPGNVRELATVIDRAAILGDGKRLEIAPALGIAATPMVSSPGAVASPKPEQSAAGAASGHRVAGHGDAPAHRGGACGHGGTHRRSRGAARLLKINPHTLRAADAQVGDRLEAVSPRRARGGVSC